MAEFNTSKVTERDFKGKVLWELQFNNPICAERLRNGNTLVAGRNSVIEYDKSKKEVMHINRNAFDIFGARKLRNGQIVVITQTGTCVFYDAKGKKELKSFQVGMVGTYNCMDVTPSGNVIVAMYNNSKVAEFNSKGKIVWEVAAQWPSGATRLPNGNTLVCCQDQQKVLEFDRKGKEVWSHAMNGRPFCARRR
jgi:hypothetical protein